MSTFSFHIDSTLSYQNASLVIRVEGSNSQDNGVLIQDLEKEDMRYMRRHSESKRIPSLYRILPGRSFALLKALGASGQFYLDQKKIIVDVFSQVEVSYLIAKDGERYLVEGWIKSGSKEFSIDECDFMMQGMPHYFVYQGMLKCFNEDLEWKWLSPFASSEPYTIVKKEKLHLQCLLEDADDPALPTLLLLDDDEPIISEAAPIQSREIYPVLKLKDRSGAFADLWIDYGDGDSCHFHDFAPQGFPRILDEEKSFERDLLETAFSFKLMDHSHYYCPVDQVKTALAFLIELAWTVLDKEGRELSLQTGQEVLISTHQEQIKIEGFVQFDDLQYPITKALDACRAQEHFIPLMNGKVGLLTNEALQPLSLLGTSIKRSQFACLKPILKHATLDAETQVYRSALSDFQALRHTPPSSFFHGELRVYQQEGLNWLSFLHEYAFHGILADDMGLGKTVQILAFISLLQKEERILLVAPTSLLFHWKRECQRFLPSYPVAIHYGPERGALPTSGLIVTSYRILQNDLELFSQERFYGLFLDEAQAIKNPSTQVFKAVCQIQARLRLSITGTPVENSLQDLWAQFRFIMPDLLGDDKDLPLPTLKRLVKPFILRRKKEHVAKDLPEKIEQTIWVEMEADQRSSYDDFLARFKNKMITKMYEGDAKERRMEIFEAILRLRQICCNPQLVFPAFDGNSAKFIACISDIQTVIDEGYKVLVYSQFTEILKGFVTVAKERKWGHALLHGQSQNREKMVDAFQNDPHCSVFFVSLKAGGVGLNLTAADYVFLFDPWWNVAVENQAIDRAHRIGRKGEVIARRYVMINSIEEKMMLLKEKKVDLVKDLFDDRSSSLSMDDLEFLLA